MQDETNAAKVREDFTRLCVMFAPPHRKPERQKNASKELESLLCSGRFTRIAVIENTLLARTHLVRAYRKDAVYRIGEYMIEIEQKSFAAYNLTCQVQSYHGPHINAAGHFCMRDGKCEIETYIADGQLDRALLLIEHALWVFDSGTPFQVASVENWPLEKEGESS